MNDLKKSLHRQIFDAGLFGQDDTAIEPVAYRLAHEGMRVPDLEGLITAHLRGRKHLKTLRSDLEGVLETPNQWRADLATMRAAEAAKVPEVDKVRTLEGMSQAQKQLLDDNNLEPQLLGAWKYGRFVTRGLETREGCRPWTDLETGCAKLFVYTQTAAYRKAVLAGSFPGPLTQGKFRAGMAGGYLPLMEEFPDAWAEVCRVAEGVGA